MFTDINTALLNRQAELNLIHEEQDHLKVSYIDQLSTLIHQRLLASIKLTTDLSSFSITITKTGELEYLFKLPLKKIEDIITEVGNRLRVVILVLNIFPLYVKDEPLYLKVYLK